MICVLISALNIYYFSMSVISLFLRGKEDRNNSIYKCDFTLNVLVKNPIQKGAQYVTEINYLVETMKSVFCKSPQLFKLLNTK